MSIPRIHPATAVLLLAATLAPRATAAPPETPQILVSRQLMAERELRVGQTVRLATSPDGGDATEFVVAGSYEPVPDPFILSDRRFEVRLHLPDMIELRNPGGDPLLAEAVTRVNVALRDREDAAAFAADLTARLPGTVVRETTAGESGTDPFAVLERFHLAIAVITLVGSSAFLLALMVMRSDERRATAGILRLIGLTRRRVLLEGFIEGLVISLAGTAFGVLLAKALEGAFNRFFQWHYDTALVFVAVTPGIVLRCLLLALPLGTLAGLCASWALLRREILALLRR